MVVMAAFAVDVAVLEFHWIGFAHVIHLATKEKRNARHGVVKVQFYFVQPHPGNRCLKMIALIVLQGQDVADFQQAIGYFTFVFEHAFVHFDQRGFVVLAIRVGRLDGESKLVTCLEALQIALKLRQHHADAKDEAQRLPPFGRLNQFAGSISFGQGVVDSHYFFFFNNHLIKICGIPEGLHRRPAETF